MFRTLTVPVLMAMVAALFTPSLAAGEPPPSEARSIRARLTTSEPAPLRIIGSPESQSPGARSRFMNYVGTLEAAGIDTVAIRVGDSRVLLAFDRVTRFEVSRGRSSNFGRGILYGAAFGAGLGALSGLGQEGMLAGPGVGAAGGGVAGIVIGGIVGAATRSERWEDLPLESLRKLRVPDDALPARDAPPAGQLAPRSSAHALVGEVIRVHAPTRGPAPISGRLWDWTDRSVTVKRGGELDSVPRQTILSVEVRRGSRGNGSLGMLVGFGCGFLTGTIVQATRGGEIGTSAMAGGVAGMPLGAIVGSLIRTPAWEPVPLAQPPGHAADGR